MFCLIEMNVANNLLDIMDLRAVADSVNVLVLIAMRVLCFQMKPLDQHGFNRVEAMIKADSRPCGSWKLL